MSVDVVVPQVGEAVSSVTISRWLRCVGDQVQAGEPLFEVDTEKANIEIEAVVSGRLIEILAAEGAEVQPMQVVARIAVHGEHHEANTPTTTHQPAEVPSPTDTPRTPTTVSSASAVSGERIRATPRAKVLARELNIDLAGIHPSGPAGMICVADVQQAAANREQKAAATPESSALTEEQALSGRRLAIARTMTLSKTTIPHFYIMRDVDMTQAARLRDYLGSLWGGDKPSYTVLLVKACALALRSFPILNINLRDNHIYQRSTIDIGVAVAVPPAPGEIDSGLVVPVVREADKKSLTDIAQELSQLVERARGNRMRLEDMETTGRSLTISNLGMYGVDTFVPIIYPPDPMLMAAGAVARRPWVDNNELTVRLVMTLTLAADHRVMDGVLGAQYIDRVRQILEYPYELMR